MSLSGNVPHGLSIARAQEVGAFLRHNNCPRPDSVMLTPERMEVGQRNVFLPGVSIVAGDGRIEIGNGNTFYTGTTIIANDGRIVIEDGNTFNPGTYIATEGRLISIGNGNMFGPGGCVIKSDKPYDEQDPYSGVTIGHNGRYQNGAWIGEYCALDDGSQILGNVIVRNVTLEGGMPSTHQDVLQRGAVLEGVGIANGLCVAQGHVIRAYGDFKQDSAVPQTTLYPL